MHIYKKSVVSEKAIWRNPFIHMGKVTCGYFSFSNHGSIWRPNKYSMNKTKENNNMLTKVAESLKEAFDQVDEVYQLGSIKLEEIEKELNNIQHEIEITEFNPFTAYQVIKRVQELRRERRELKNDLYLSDIIMRQFGGRDKAAYKFEGMKAKVKNAATRQEGVIKDTSVIRNLIAKKDHTVNTNVG